MFLGEISVLLVQSQFLLLKCICSFFQFPCENRASWGSLHENWELRQSLCSSLLGAGAKSRPWGPDSEWLVVWNMAFMFPYIDILGIYIFYVWNIYIYIYIYIYILGTYIGNDDPN